MCKGSGERAIGGVEMVEGKELSLEQKDVVGCFKGGTYGCIGMGCGSSLPPIVHKPCENVQVDCIRVLYDVCNSAWGFFGEIHFCRTYVYSVYNIYLYMVHGRYVTHIHVLTFGTSTRNEWLHGHHRLCGDVCVNQGEEYCMTTKN